jgi:hypothetical protein
VPSIVSEGKGGRAVRSGFLLSQLVDVRFLGFVVDGISHVEV